MNPLPSFIRASAWDAANMAMRKAGRSKWSKTDYNHACSTQERLVKNLYGKPSDHNQPELCYIRFQIADQLERAGQFSHKSKLPEVYATIEAILDGGPA